MDEKILTHIDLFSGIGGFTLAAEWAGFKTIVFCEKEKFCQEVLKKRFGAIADTKHMRKLQSERGKQKQRRWISDFPILIPEIRDVDGTKYQGATLLTGGFPCQPFSVAGQRRGKEDDRYLWPEMRRVIGEAKPRWILAENVPGIFHMALDTVLADLESEGYTTGTFIIPACGLNAPHRRNRVWIVANLNKQGLEGQERREATGFRNRPKRPNSDAPDSDRFNGNDAGLSPGEIPFIKKAKIQRCNATNPTGKGLSKPQKSSFTKLLLSAQRGDWEKPWHEVAARFCRMDDGISDRVHRLKALGNAIVPQIAFEILRYIGEIERGNL